MLLFNYPGEELGLDRVQEYLKDGVYGEAIYENENLVQLLAAMGDQNARKCYPFGMDVDEYCTLATMSSRKTYKDLRDARNASDGKKLVLHCKKPRCQVSVPPLKTDEDARIWLQSLTGNRRWVAYQFLLGLYCAALESPVLGHRCPEPAWLEEERKKMKKMKEA